MAPSYAMQGGVVTNGYGAPATMMGGMAGPGASNAPGGLDANLQAELVKLCDQVDAGDLALDSGGDAFMGPFSEALAPTDMLGHGKDGHNDELMSLLLKVWVGGWVGGCGGGGMWGSADCVAWYPGGTKARQVVCTHPPDTLSQDGVME